MLKLLARDMHTRLGGQEGEDLAVVEQRLRLLAALAPDARRDAVTALPADESDQLLIGAFGYGATREDPWNTHADAQLLAATLEAYAAGITVGSGKEWESARHVKGRLTAQARLLRAVEADAAGDRAEANRLFDLACGQGETAGDWLVCALGLLGRTACGSEAHLAEPSEIMELAAPVIDELAQYVEDDLGPLRQAFHLRYEAFGVVRSAVGAEDADTLLSLVRSWLDVNPQGAMVELAHAWSGEMGRGVHDGDLDWAVGWAAWGDQLIAPAQPGSRSASGSRVTSVPWGTRSTPSRYSSGYSPMGPTTKTFWSPSPPPTSARAVGRTRSPVCGHGSRTLPLPARRTCSDSWSGCWSRKTPRSWSTGRAS